MNLLNVQGVFGIVVGLIGVAYLADAMGNAPNESPFGPTSAYSAPSIDVAGLFNISAFADEAPAPDDLSDLLRIDLPHANVVLGPQVGTQVLGTSTVRKIEFGQVSSVQVYSTVSGDYSTDGLSSVHVQYPGVDVTPRHPHRSRHAGGHIWTRGFGWVPAPHAPAHSFMTYGMSPNAGAGSHSSGLDCGEQAGVTICG